MQESVRLLLLGDSPEDAEAVVAELERGGLQPGWKRVDSEPLLRAALRGRWDVVISDYAMSRLDGPQAFEIVRQHNPRAPFIFVSEPMGEARAVAAMRAGVRHCVNRQELHGLAEIVRGELERTELERAALARENGLVMSQRRYQSIFDTAPVGLLEVDLSGASRFLETFAAGQSAPRPGAGDELERRAAQRVRVLAANAAALALLGAEREEQMLGPQVLCTSERNAWVEVLRALRESSTPTLELQIEVATFDGREVPVLLALRVPDSAERLANVTISLVPVPARSELSHQLESAQRMEAVGRLAGRTAHDLNNFLTVIRGYTGLLTDTLPEEDPVRQDLGIIDTAAAAAEQLASQLMSCKRPSRWEPEVLSINSHISRLTASLKETLGDGVDLVTALSDGVWDVEIDRSCLETLLGNLITNAREAMPEGGRLTIETGNTHLEGAAVAGGAGTLPVPRGDYAVLTVSDTGLGMDEQTLHCSLEPFFTTRRDAGNAGMGLAVAYGIVRQTGGMIWAHSEPGAGSVFEVLLPRHHGN